MRRIESRIRKIEAELQLGGQPRVTGLACVWHRVPIERKKNLGPGERVVVDWYRNWGTMTHGRERVTKDLEDHGRVCKRGGYLLDVLEELHQSCVSKGRGSCGDCANTPVAEVAPAISSNTLEQELVPVPDESILEHQHDELDEEDEE
jgi:hypothetical protein